jgi:hypothetical protein
MPEETYKAAQYNFHPIDFNPFGKYENEHPVPRRSPLNL